MKFLNNTVYENEDFCFIFFKEDEKIGFEYPSAFKVASGIRNNTKLLDEYIGSLVVCSDLNLKLIKHIKKKEIYGSTTFSKVFNYIRGLYKIKTTFEIVKKLTFEEFKDCLIDNLENDKIYKQSGPSDYFYWIDNNIYESTKIILKDLRKAKNYKDILEAFRHDEIWFY